MMSIRSLFLHPTPRRICAGICLALTGALAAAADTETQPARKNAELPSQPMTFSKQTADRLGVKNVAYLLAIDVNGNVVPFVPEEPKSAFRFIDPAREKLTMDLFEIEPFTIIAGRRNPFCVIFVGGSARKLWMESCP
ncbi:hypothetical protein RCH09_000622 [Actimicrobium sp. GrIS 1.19]|uniref:hypothetical protein n=1 Tax=Actimicrobium sp. GrIS 1.19 TaxID=3071708 RepID=UPI002DF9E85F|nr:hypothetical protein [Actimicrobium sp. GrIS 1.19]